MHAGVTIQVSCAVPGLHVLPLSILPSSTRAAMRYRYTGLLDTSQTRECYRSSLVGRRQFEHVQADVER